MRGGGEYVMLKAEGNAGCTSVLPTREPPGELTPRALLSAVGCADADPGVAHLLIVDLRIVDQNVEAEARH